MSKSLHPPSLFYDRRPPEPARHQCLGDDTLPICAAGLKPMLAHRLEGLTDPEGLKIPPDLPPVIDAHVHLFPDRIFAAIWRWFDTYGWPIRYPLRSPEVIDFLLSRGVARIIALQYAHKPGIAASMNQWMAKLCAAHPRVTGLATVFPGEDGAADILEAALGMGLAGVKLHCHVQAFSVDDPALTPLYELCAAFGRPMIIHAGREPKSPGYKVDPWALCHVDRVEKVLRAHPDLKLIIPHLGADEFDAYGHLLTRYDNLWLDTAVVLADFLPGDIPDGVLNVRPERILYGTDFPNLPYAWDRELKALRGMKLSDHALEQILSTNAAGLFPDPADTPSD